MQENYTIRARIGDGVLAKADRLFRNDDEGLFIEVLQNSRRAGATLVDVTIEDIAESASECHVAVHDNGKGIEDFAKLLVLGESGWEETTQVREDPAGMGFYALCLSGVQVASGYQYSNILPAAFLGEVDPLVESREEYVAGTRLRFRRASSKPALVAALAAATQFYPVEVRLNGESIPRHDFLEGALHREVIDGIEIGFATQFAHDWRPYYSDKNWNFYGARIHDHFPNINGILPAGANQSEPSYLYARFNVVETGRIKLQLPDRRNVIQNEFLTEFKKKARAAAYRCFQKQSRHVLSFEDWKEAQKLGIQLPEAVPLLTTWSGLAADGAGEQFFDEDMTVVVPELSRVMLVGGAVVDVHTLQGALHSGASLDCVLYRERPGFRGYHWYDALPRLSDMEVIIDGMLGAEYLSSRDERPSRIDLSAIIEQEGREDRVLVLPAQIHVDSEQYNSLNFVAVKNSPWDNDELEGPFPVGDFLIYSTFSPSDEGDLWETQMDAYFDEVEQITNEYFRGPRASLMALLRREFGRDASHLAARLNVSQITFTRDPEKQHKWNVELIGADAQRI